MDRCSGVIDVCTSPSRTIAWNVRDYADYGGLRVALVDVDNRQVDKKSQNHNPHGGVSPRESRPGSVFRLDITHTDTREGSRTVCPMAVSSRDLAAALASRLDAVAPPGVSVRAEGAAVHVVRGGTRLGGSAAPEIITDRADRRQVETAARSTISGVQDVFAEELAEPWPASHGDMPAPEVRIAGGVLLAWFGSEEQPFLSLGPYSLSPR